MKHSELTSLILNAMSAAIAAAQTRWNIQWEEKQYHKHGEYINQHRRSRKTISAATLKRAAKKRANVRARSKK